MSFQSGAGDIEGIRLINREMKKIKVGDEVPHPEVLNEWLHANPG